MRNLRKTKPMMWLMVLTMLVSMIGIVPMAAAAGDYSAMKVPALTDDPDIRQALGGVKIVVDAGSLEEGDVLTIELPKDITLKTGNFDVVDTLPNDNSNCLYVPDLVSGGDDNGIFAEDFDFDVNNDLDEIQLTLNANGSSVDDAYMYLYLRSVEVEDGVTGDAVITFDAPANSGFSSGDVVVATIGSGDVTVTVTDEETSNSDFEVTIRVKENVAGALEVDDESLKFTLPDGFEWKSNSDFDVTYKWGEKDLDLDVDVDEDELYLDFNGPATEEATCFEITLQFEVADETDAELGDVLVKVGGESDIASDAELVAGIYGEYGGVVEVKGKVPTVYAGQTEQEIAEIQIRELLADTFMKNRTITLTLPAQARWVKVDDTKVNADTEAFDIDSDAGDYLKFAGLTGDNDRTLKLSFDKVSSNDEAELLLENCEIATQQGFSGDIKVTIGGSQGIDGEVVVANCVPVVSIEASSKPQVKIGLSDQVIGDFTITEKVAGAISDENPNASEAKKISKSTVLLLDAPDGVQFSAVPKVEVVTGDLEIDEDNVTRQANNNQVVIPIDDSSDVASVIKVSGLKLTIDRTVPEGDVVVKVQGAAVTETGPETLGGNNMWVNNATAAQTMMATVVTPAPGETTQTSSFVIGSTEYKVGGVAQTMDVAPYIKGDRTYLPIRYVGYALGVAEQNILWDDASKSATLIMGDKVVQVKIGSTTMLVNGVAIAMDVAPEITDGRTMLPFRFIGQAFGADFTWDDATKTVTMKI